MKGEKIPISGKLSKDMAENITKMMELPEFSLIENNLSKMIRHLIDTHPKYMEFIRSKGERAG